MNAVRLEMMKIDALGAMACAGLVGAAYVLGVQPLVRAGAERASLDVGVMALSERVEAERAATESYGAALSLIDERLSAEPVELRGRDALSEVLSGIGQRAEERGLVVDALTPKPPESGKVFDRVPIEVRGRGSYADVAGFVHDVRSQDASMALRVVELRGDDAQGSTFNLELVWFVRAVTPSG